MSATKAQFTQLLATNSGLTLVQAQAAVNALSETTGQWLHDNGQNGPGSFTGGCHRFTVILNASNLLMNNAPSNQPTNWAIQKKPVTCNMRRFDWGGDLPLASTYF